MRRTREMLTALVVIVLVAGTCWASSTSAEIKWSQPIVRLIEIDSAATDPELIYGWDEVSMVDFPIAAADFRCNDIRPVTDVHWWGSFPHLENQGIPPTQPDGFIIRFWTDLPAGEDPDDNVTWSHPLEKIWEVDVRIYQVEHAGYDIDVWEYAQTGDITIVDEAFQYNVTFDPTDYFDQEIGTIYWISIQAYFDEIDDANVWGWKTRPWFFNDDGVIGYPSTDGGVDWIELMGPDPGGTQEVSWDYAFELSVPEPATMGLLGVGGVAALIRRRRRRHV